jgi:hypothetical protein
LVATIETEEADRRVREEKAKRAAEHAARRAMEEEKRQWDQSICAPPKLLILTITILATAVLSLNWGRWPLLLLLIPVGLISGTALVAAEIPVGCASKARTAKICFRAATIGSVLIIVNYLPHPVHIAIAIAAIAAAWFGLGVATDGSISLVALCYVLIRKERRHRTR